MKKQGSGYNYEGYIVVHVTTAQGAIPLSGALVRITGATSQNSCVRFSLITDAEGRTEKVALPAPDSSLIRGEMPFAAYDIEITKPGFVPVVFSDVPVYGAITSIQPVIMIPVSEDSKNNSPPERLIYYEYQKP